MSARRLLPFWLLALLLLVNLDGGAAETWFTDLGKAQAKAQAEGKPVLIHFSGSDWCGWCMKLRKEVFSKAEFDGYARSNLVLLLVDFPKHKQVAPGLQSTNQQVAQQFQVQGFPTLILLDSQGRRLGNVNYAQGGTRAFLAEIERLRQLAREAAVQAQAKNETKADSGLSLSKLLTLKRITGSKQRRRAVINDCTFSTGEIAMVKLAEGAVQIQCLEIRGDSVVISINGQKEKRELKLSRRI
jgi:thioredoxin-related protein